VVETSGVKPPERLWVIPCVGLLWCGLLFVVQVFFLWCRSSYCGAGLLIVVQASSLRTRRLEPCTTKKDGHTPVIPQGLPDAGACVL
jgi:hypothetical protein